MNLQESPLVRVLGKIGDIRRRANKWAKDHPVDIRIIFAVGTPLIIFIGGFIYYSLFGEEPESRFQADVIDQCNNPPNVGKFVRKAIANEVIVPPGTIVRDRDAFERQSAALDAALCAKVREAGTYEEILQFLSDAYSRCFTFIPTPGEQKTFEVVFGTPDVCYAPASTVNGKHVPDLKGDKVYICVTDPPAKAEQSGRPRECTETELRRYGWLKPLTP